MKENYQSKIIGLLFLVGGIVVLGNQMGYWDFSIFFPGWWTICLILPAIFSMIDSGIHMGNMVLFLLGGYFFLQANDWIDVHLTFGSIVAIICILVGVRMMFGFQGRKEKTYREGKEEAKNIKNIHSNVIFGSRKFRGTGIINSLDVQCTMGTQFIDLSEADVRNMEYASVNCVIGSIDVLIPSDMNYVVKKDNIVGSCFIQDEPLGKYDFYVDVSCVLGQVNLRKKKVVNVKEGEFKEK